MAARFPYNLWLALPMLFGSAHAFAFKAGERVLEGESESAEWTSAGFAFIWAIVLASASSTFDTSPVYDAMRFMAEGTWALVFAALTGLTIAGWSFGVTALRRYCLHFGTAFWLAMAMMMGKSAPAATGWVYLVPATACAVGYLRLRARSRR